MGKKYQINVYNWNTGCMEAVSMSESERRHYAEKEMKNAIFQKYDNPDPELVFPAQYTLFVYGENAVSIAEKLCNGYCYTQFHGGQLEAVTENCVAISFFPNRVAAYKAMKIAKELFKSPIEMVEEKDFVLNTPEYGYIIDTKESKITSM